MKRRILPLMAVLCLALSGTRTEAQVTYLQAQQTTNLFNALRMTNGTANASTETDLPSISSRVSGSTATAGQFASFNNFVAYAPITGTNAVSSPSSTNAYSLGMTRIGTPVMGLATTFQFGQIIPRPNVDEDGNEVVGFDYWQARPFFETDRLGYAWDEDRQIVHATEAGTFDITWQKAIPENGTPSDIDTNPDDYLYDQGSYYQLYTFTHRNVAKDATIPPPSGHGILVVPAPSEYWVARPHSLAEEARYYFSESASAVFATQPGPVEVTWQAKSPTAGDHSTNSNFIEIGGNFFRLYTERYDISSSTVKTPQKIYWTAGEFTGAPVLVPDARIDAVKIVYNTDFPENVPVSEGVSLDSGTGVGSDTTVNTSLTGTLWYSSASKSLQALNREGRVFVELLGKPRQDGIAEFLGFEIVDVIKRPTPEDHSVDLGERIPALYRDADGAELYPRLANLTVGASYVFQDLQTSGDQLSYFATRETENVNDLAIWWLGEGVQGLQWPQRYARYALDWPTDVAKYSHYVRPLVSTKSEAEETAVQLDLRAAPFIEYQDALDQDRAFLTPSTKFYTYLDTNQPVHRTLLRTIVDNEVGFERVYSWLDEALIGFTATSVTNLGTVTTRYSAPGLAGTVAEDLSGYDSISGTYDWESVATAPRVVTSTVNVGNRINAPGGEYGSGAEDGYLAGHINVAKGDAYNPNTYTDPFGDGGFTDANLGAIIPVNAAPDNNLLEVLWFRSNGAGSANVDETFWPSAIGRYTIQYPANAAKIVLASNDGTGALPSTVSRGSIYYQNDSSLTGYNPNEEHALMQGGQGFALRDDLNITTNTNGEYTSEPFVLIEYTAADERPAMAAFEVQREDVAGGSTFTYDVPAGQILQGPMPLPLLGIPFVTNGIGEEINPIEEAGYLEVNSATIDGSFVSELITRDRPAVTSGATYQLQSADLSDHKYLVVTKSSPDTHTIEGYAMTNSPTTATNLSVDDGNASGYGYTASQDQSPIAYFSADTGVSLAVGDTVVVIDQTTLQEETVSIASSIVESGNLVLGVTVPSSAYTTFTYEYTYNETVSGTNQTRTADKDRYTFDSFYYSDLILVTPDESLADGDLDDYYVSATVLQSADLVSEQLAAKYTYHDRKGNVWVYRGPHSSEGPSATESFDVQYYYKTLDGFWFPEEVTQPTVGTVVPYLRSLNSDGSWAGSGSSYQTNGLPITYRPYWPDAPTLFRGETLALPKRGLPSVRGNTSAEILYQQSDRQSSVASVVLHDATREKQFNLVEDGNLDKIPESAATEPYLGNTFFPNLPPHLVDRFWFDPNRGSDGALVFKGEFRDEVIGDDYFLLNALGTNDLNTLKDLVIVGDNDKAAWDAAIDGLETTVEHFVENESVPGTYIPGTGRDQDFGPQELAAITDSDQAVDSYALSAAGPGSGYITLIFGDGEAFTPIDDPTQIQIVKVSDQLYRGEVKVITPSNPLSEKVTMQQVTDLANEVGDYTFEWKIASPVDGLPPVVSLNERSVLLATGASWDHLQFPSRFDSATGLVASDPRLTTIGLGTVTALETIAHGAVSSNGVAGTYHLSVANSSLFTAGNSVAVTTAGDISVPESVNAVTEMSIAAITNSTSLNLSPNGPQPAGFDIIQLQEFGSADQAASIIRTTFTVPTNETYTTLYLSLDIANDLGANVFINGTKVVQVNRSQFGATNADSSTTEAPDGFTALANVYAIPTEVLNAGIVGDNITNTVAVELYSQGTPGSSQTFGLQIEAYRYDDQTGANWLTLDAAKHEDGVRALLGGTADVRSLSDNYLIMRYRPTANATGWSQWTEPRLAEGWIKRVLAGINPFNQRVTDFLNNAVDTDASVLQEAGGRWEGDVALNLDSINDYGLIEIYETVLRRGRSLSIDADINYGPANDALLLVAGYLNDLYMIVGNEAKADALNPTIGIGTAHETYGDVATAMFAFKGQVNSLLEEELALWRGRDDFLQPGVELSPVYNRLVWNYTRGIDSGEVIYALNYNIQEDQDGEFDGIVNAEDAAQLYPQGHGDAYGHFLTATKGYYSLLLDPDFTWVPRIEAVNVLGVPVSVDYQDERKFASAALALAEAGEQIMELTWRKDFQTVEDNGWEHLSESRDNTQRTLPTTRYWGVDHWGSRVGQGSYLNWVVGNAILPAVDTDPTHEGIQIVDRTSVTELIELATIGDTLQKTMDNVETGLNPLGLPADSISFDIQPSGGQSAGSGFATGATSHFEQILDRAKSALNNAVASFDDAKDFTRTLRSEEDALAEFRTKVDQQEFAFTNQLIEIYGTPYTDDIGPGKTYTTGYAGPDLLHYMYVDRNSETFGSQIQGDEQQTFRIDIQQVATNWASNEEKKKFQFITPSSVLPVVEELVNKTIQIGGFIGIAQETDRHQFVDDAPILDDYTEDEHYIEFTLDSDGFFSKPAGWTGRRASPGKIQVAIANVLQSHNGLQEALRKHRSLKYELDRQIEGFHHAQRTYLAVRNTKDQIAAFEAGIDFVEQFGEFVDGWLDYFIDRNNALAAVAILSTPDNQIAGLSAGGDMFSAVKAGFKGTAEAINTQYFVAGFANQVATIGTKLGLERAIYQHQLNEIDPQLWNQESRERILPIEHKLQELNLSIHGIVHAIEELEKQQLELRALTAKGQRVQQERLIFRKRAAAVTQGFRTRDAAFRLFRDEKLERYKTLFDLAAKYTFLTAQAYDYETGLLHTDEGQAFIQRIINSRALGIVRDGKPHFAGSDEGDPGLSSVLAEMEADWSVVKSRLGFNNPDVYGTTVSLRTENHRLLPDHEGDTAWRDVLENGRVANLLDDKDVQRYCMQIDNGDGLQVPGIVLEFSTTIADRYNLFGRELAAGDSAFSQSSFANKIFSVGMVFDGYQGISNPTANSSVAAVTPDPDVSFLSSDGLSATPYAYLIPVGTDSMRSPPLGDQSVIRNWQVNDVTIPLPFNIGASDFSTKPLYTSNDALTEDLFSVRKHQAFRPVSTDAVYAGDNGRLLPSQYTNSRLIGRSVWNSKWKIVIPGKNLLHNENEGLDRFIRTVKDIKIHFETYSYAGN